MPTVYPTSKQTWTNRNATDALSVGTHADYHADLNDTVEALEARVGADDSAVATSHDYMLQGPYVYLRANGLDAPSLTMDTYASIPFGPLATEDTDLAGLHDPDTNPSRITFDRAGVVAVWGYIGVEENDFDATGWVSGNGLSLRLLLNGATTLDEHSHIWEDTATGAVRNAYIDVFAVYPVVATDYVEVQMRTNRDPMAAANPETLAQQFFAAAYIPGTQT